MAKDKKIDEPGKNRNGASVHSGKKKLKEKAASGKSSSLSNTSHATERSLRITKDKKFKKVAKGSKKDVLETTITKKRKLEDKGIFAESSEGDASTITIHETGLLRGRKIRKSKADAKKSKSLQKKTRKEDKSEVNVISALPSSDNQKSDDEDSGVKAQVLIDISSSQSTEEASNRKTSKGMKKKKMKKLIKSQGKQISEKQGSPSKAEFEDTEEIQSIDEDCSRKKIGAKARVLNEISSPQGTEEASNEKVPKGMKKKKNKKITNIRGNQILGKQGSPSKEEFEDVEEIQSVDEDCSRGMKKWLIEYHESRPGVEVLHNRIDEFVTSYEEQKEQERKEREAQAAEGGWTVVVHHKGRKKTTDSESGVAVGSVAQAAVVDNLAKKKSKEPPIDFYRFQKREAQRNEVMMLQSKFEQDKKRIQQLRAARKFRPY